MVTEITDQLKFRYLIIASTCVYKIRLAQKYDKVVLKNYISRIGNDELFNSSFDLKTVRKLSYGRKLIVFLLHIKLYSFLRYLVLLTKKFF